MKIYEQTVTIKDWAEDDQPREKLVRLGRRNVSDAELIAILITSGNTEETAVDLSKRILGSMDNDIEQLGQVSVQELSRFKGIGPAKAVTIIAALELGRRRKEALSKEKVAITHSLDIYNLMSRYFNDLDHEEFWIVLLNRANKAISKHLISTGGQSATLADPKIVFRLALENQAASIILAHNHPSGSLKPSKADISLTQKLCSAAALLDMGVLDHLIFVNSSYFSFADEGMM